jgi:PAS domain S-box-containing protein
VQAPELAIHEADALGRALVQTSVVLESANNALKNSETRMGGILLSSMDAIITVDEAKNIVLFNAAAATMFGCPAQDAIGTPMTRFIPIRLHAQYADSLEQRENPDEHGDATGVAAIAVGLRQGGEEFPAEVSFSSVVEGGVWLHTMIIRDVTSRVEAYRALERSNLDLEQFAYVASHDLRTPLRSISGFIQLLEKNHAAKLDENALGLIKRATNATKRLEQLTEDLLSYARIDAAAKEFAPVNMTEVAHEVVQLLDATITTSEAVVHIDDLPVVMGDRTQLIQLLLNLIGNGLKYCRGRASVVKLSAVKRDNFWVFSVTDNGIGIAAQHLEKVFEVFKRLHTQNEFAGTGIGLAVCRRVVEGHGGKIWVTSEPGQGSVFSFTIKSEFFENPP